MIKINNDQDGIRLSRKLLALQLLHCIVKVRESLLSIP